MTSRFNVGRSLRAAQEIRELPNSVVASEMGVGNQQVSIWRHKADNKFSTVKKLADLFEMSLDEFDRLGR